MMLANWFWVALAAAFVGPAISWGQVGPETPFAGHRVAVYVSKKNLAVANSLKPPIAAFLQLEDSLGLTEENIRLAFSVKLGNYLTQGLSRELHADSSYFLNATPALAQKFVPLYTANRWTPERPSSTELLSSLWLPNTRYLLALDSLSLHTETRRAYFAISNRITTERREVIVARAAFRVFEVPSGQLVASAHYTYDTERSPEPTPYITSAGQSTPAVAFLDEVVNEGLQRLVADGLALPE